MKRMLLLVFLVGCQKQEDPSTSTSTSTSTSASTSTSTSTSASATLTPLATIEPMATASVPRPDGGSIEDKRRAALAQQAEQMQLQMLQALGSNGPATQGVLNSKDIPPVDLSAIAAGARDGGAGMGDLRLGSGGGTIRPGGAGGGLAGIGARDH